VQAFAFFGGVPATVVPDNLKAAVVRAAFTPSEPMALNRSYRELARHYGFKVDPTPPYAPQKKGKVESGVKYVQRNFFPGRDGADVDPTQAELTSWVRQIAGTREHGSTGKKPLELFEQEEKGALRPLPLRPYESAVWKQARGAPGLPRGLRARQYSVRKWRPMRAGGGEPRSTNEAHLPDHRADLRHRSRSYWEERAARIGPESAAYVKALFESDDVLSMLRSAQAVVTHLEKFRSERAEATRRRATYFGPNSGRVPRGSSAQRARID